MSEAEAGMKGALLQLGLKQTTVGMMMRRGERECVHACVQGRGKSVVEREAEGD